MTVYVPEPAFEVRLMSLVDVAAVSIYLSG